MKMHQLYPILIILFVCGMFFSCEDSGDPVMIIPHQEYSNQFYPMDYGNSWTYTDTLFTNGNTTVTNFSMVIVRYRCDSTGNWWKFQSYPDTLLRTYELMIRHDTVFDLQWGWGDPFANIRYIKPKSNDSITYLSLYGGDIGGYITAYRNNGLYRTPMAEFKHCIVYQTNFTTQGYYEVIAPGIGLVGFDYYSENYHRKVRLTECRLDINIRN